jgi:anti-sigma regulatory factor (Ser/Thr protein kinase)
MTTVTCAVLDPAAETLTYSSAGHPPPLLVAPHGPAEYLWDGRSSPLGTLVGGKREEASRRIVPGSTLLLYSDGLVERRRERLDSGLERLRRAVERQHGRGLLDCDEVVAVALDGHRQSDDVALLVVELDPYGGDGFVERLPATPQALAPLRQALRAWLRKQGLDPVDERDLLLAVGELVSNAVEHAYHSSRRADEEVLVEAWMEDDVVEARVRDFGRWRRTPAPGNRGRGLGIVRALVRDVELSQTAAGTEARVRTRARAAVPATPPPSIR